MDLLGKILQGVCLAFLISPAGVFAYKGMIFAPPVAYPILGSHDSAYAERYTENFHYYRNGYHVCLDPTPQLISRQYIYRDISGWAYFKPFPYPEQVRMAYLNCSIHPEPCDIYRQCEFGWYAYYVTAQRALYRCQHYWR